MTVSDDIVNAVAAEYSVLPRKLYAYGRSTKLAEARKVAMYLVRHNTNLSLPQIGTVFGRDHTTVLSAVVKVGQRRQEDADFSAALDRIMAGTLIKPMEESNV